MDIIGKKWLYFLFSGLIILPGLISLALWGVRPAIDFSGGTLIEVQSPRFKVQSEKDELKKIIEAQKIEIGSITHSGDDSYLLRLKPIDKSQNDKLQEEMVKQFGEIKEIRFETVGPSIGRETTENAIKAVIVASVAIILYIAFAFRTVPKPYSSLKFGICAVMALIHDVLVIVGLF